MKIAYLDDNTLGSPATVVAVDVILVKAHDTQLRYQ